MGELWAVLFKLSNGLNLFTLPYLASVTKAAVLDMESLVCCWSGYRGDVDWKMDLMNLNEFSREKLAFKRVSSCSYTIVLEGKGYLFSISAGMQLCLNGNPVGLSVMHAMLRFVSAWTSGDGIFHLVFWDATLGSLHLWLDTVIDKVLCYAWDAEDTFLVSTLINIEGLPKQAEGRLERLRGRITKSALFGDIVGNRIY